MATTTAVIFEDSFTLPELGFPEQASRVVRFDNECVLIPKSPTTRSKLPVVLTKSYSLPLWKKKSPDSDAEDAATAVGSSAGSQSPEENRVTIKVPIPTFKRRSSSRSPTPRARSVSISPTIPSSLPSCLVYRSPSELASRPSPMRRPSLPIYHRRQDELTIPLRDCCADCQRITEECLKEGSGWEEKFSRGARRRRSASLEYRDSTLSSSHRINSNPTKAAEAGASKDLTSRFPTSSTAFSITVDEVDRRRKTFDYSMEDTDFIRSLSPPPFHSSTSPLACSSGSSLHPRVKPRNREASSSSTASSMSTTDELPLPSPDILDSYTRLRSSPIEEEDETQLFPLPLRSRSNTPSPSPSASPNGSSSSLSVRNAPHPSPTSSKRSSCSPQGKKVSNNSPSRKVKDRQPSDTPNQPGSSAIQVPSTIPPNNDISDQNSPPPSPSILARRPFQQKGRLSFTLPFIKAGGAIRDAGVDVLRGVTSMSSGGLSA